MLKDRKIYYLQARPIIFQPGNFTGRGSERVKPKPHKKKPALQASPNWHLNVPAIIENTCTTSITKLTLKRTGRYWKYLHYKHHQTDT